MIEMSATDKIWHRMRSFWRKKIPLFVVVPMVVVPLLPEVFRHFQARRLGGQSSPSDNHALGIDELVREVKKELVATEREMREKREASLFELDRFEMELNFVVRSETSSKAGAHTELVTAESEITSGSEKVQRLTLHWKAVEPEKVIGTNQTLGRADFIATPPPPLPKKGERP